MAGGGVEAVMIVMLIWIGVTGNLHSGAAAVIPGFQSMAACEAAMPRVHQFYDGFWYKAQTECADLAH